MNLQRQNAHQFPVSPQTLSCAWKPAMRLLTRPIRPWRWAPAATLF